MPLARFAAGNLTEEADIAVLLDWEIALTTDADDLVAMAGTIQLAGDAICAHVSQNRD